MKFKRMPIWRDAMRLLIEVETVVRHFPRYHKYTLDVARMKLRVIREQGSITLLGINKVLIVHPFKQ